jgi:hypothetical protein
MGGQKKALLTLYSSSAATMKVGVEGTAVSQPGPQLLGFHSPVLFSLSPLPEFPV